MREAVHAFTTNFYQGYHPAEHGTAESHELLKEQARALAPSMQHPTGGAGAAVLLERAIQKIAVSDKTPTETRHNTISQLKNKIDIKLPN